MFKTLQNTFISFFVIFQGLQEWNLEYKGVMLRGLDEYMILDERAFRIGTDQGTLLVLNFEFLLVLNHDGVTWNYTKREDLGKKRGL
jgi:hypothetical protein